MTDTKVYQLKIQLSGVTKPPVWRQVTVLSTCTLNDLHKIVQGAMGWFNCHLHQFNIGGRYYSTPFPGDDDFDAEDSRKVSLYAIYQDRLKMSIVYEYDFGDGWMHAISLESVEEFDKKAAYPKLSAGKGACPPEDCGGSHGYEQLKETMADPKSAEHKEMLEWLGIGSASEFDTSSFDLKGAQERMLNSFRAK
jgi:hypothetical protein